MINSWDAADPDPMPRASLTYQTLPTNKDKEIGRAAYIEPLLRPSLGLFGLKMHALLSPINLVPFCCNHKPAVSDCPTPNSTEPHLNR
jgi:hypothetical protein